MQLKIQGRKQVRMWVHLHRIHQIIALQIEETGSFRELIQVKEMDRMLKKEL